MTPKILAEVPKAVEQPLQSCGCVDQHAISCPRMAEEVGASMIEWRHHRLWPLWALFINGRFMRIETYDGVML